MRGRSKVLCRSQRRSCHPLNPTPKPKPQDSPLALSLQVVVGPVQLDEDGSQLNGFEAGTPLLPQVRMDGEGQLAQGPVPSLP